MYTNQVCGADRKLAEDSFHHVDEGLHAVVSVALDNLGQLARSLQTILFLHEFQGLKLNHYLSASTH